jgi:hypothetical protein
MTGASLRAEMMMETSGLGRIGLGCYPLRLARTA